MEYGVPTSIAAAFSLAEVSCVEARATEDKGVGLFVAASEVPSGTTLVSSRLSSCILASDLRGELHEHLAPDDTYGRTLAALIQLAAAHESGQATDLRAAYFLEAAPLAAMAMLLAWPTDCDAARHIVNSVAWVRSRMLRASMEREHRALAAAIDATVTFDRYLWAQLVMLSRAHAPCASRAGHALVPLVDLGNHRSTGANAKYVVTESTVSLVAVHTLSQGDEVTVSYDPDADYADLFERYGFFDESSVLHTAEIVVPTESLACKEGDVPGAEMVSAIMAYGCDSSQQMGWWWIPDERLDACPLLAALRVSLTQESERVTWTTKAGRDEWMASGTPIQAEAEARVRFAALISEHLDGYSSSSLAEDMVALAAVRQNMPRPWGVDTVREDLALRFAIFERGLLLKALDELAQLPAVPSTVPPMVVPELQAPQPPPSPPPPPQTTLTTDALPPATTPPPQVLAYAYYINMDSMPHRRRRMDAMLSRHSLSPRRVQAITPRDSTFGANAERLARCAVAPADGHATRVAPPLLANMLSHVAVWRMVAERADDEPLALVLEDDVMLLRAWRSELNRILRMLPADWDVFMLDSLPVRSEWYYSFDCATAPPLPVLAEPPTLYLDAYVLTPAAARWLLERHVLYPGAPGEDLMVDLQRQRGRVWHTHPKKLAIQTWHESGISGPGFARTMGQVYSEYFTRIPKSLYDDDEEEGDGSCDSEALGSAMVGAGPEQEVVVVEEEELPLILTTTSPNYEPCYKLFHSSLVEAGYPSSRLRVQLLELKPPFGVGTPSWHEAIGRSLDFVFRHMVGNEHRPAGGSSGSVDEDVGVNGACGVNGTADRFVIKSDADIQFFAPCTAAIRRWCVRMRSEGLDLMLMREADREAVNGGIYLIRCSARMRRFYAELIRRSQTNPGALHDQEHLNAMLGLDGSCHIGPWDPEVRFTILPDEDYIWAQNLRSKDLRRVSFHHAVAEMGVPAKVGQLARVRAAVQLAARDGRLALALSALCQGIRVPGGPRAASSTYGVGGGVASAPLPLPSPRLLLRPYTEADVRTVVGWQSAEPELPRLLGLDEPDDLEDEIEYVRHLAEGGEPTVLSLAVVLHPAATEGPGSEGHGSDGEGEVLCGTVSARFALHGAYVQQLDDGAEGAAEAAAALASSLAEGSSPPPPLDMEIEIEIERLHRRQQLGSAALAALLDATAAALPEVRCAIVRVPEANGGARRFFEAVGFGDSRENAVLAQVELRREIGTRAAQSGCGSSWCVTTPIADALPAYYINVDAKRDRRDQMETMLRVRGLVAQRVSACTLADAGVRRAAQEWDGKASGWHANAASHAAVWRLIAAADAGAKHSGTVGRSSGVRSGLYLVLEDDVMLHCDWRRMLEETLTAATTTTAATTAAATTTVAATTTATTTAAATTESETASVDCVMFDGLFMTGELSAEYGWLGPPNEGPHRALGVIFSSAYAITPEAARWLIERRAARPGSNAESYLLELQEERKASWTHLPRLAIQRWDESASSVSELSPRRMRAWFETNYFPRWPRALYEV